jgi:hypothetical protein
VWATPPPVRREDLDLDLEVAFTFASPLVVPQVRSRYRRSRMASRVPREHR